MTLANVVAGAQQGQFCPLCLSKDGVTVSKVNWEAYNGTVTKCLQCSTQYLSPLPTSEQLAKAYAEDYYGKGERKFRGPMYHILSRTKRRQANRLASYLKKGDRVLDLGCGDGLFLRQLAEQNSFELHGLEIAGKAADRAASVPGITLHLGELEKETFPDDHFHGIHLYHVFEHLTNPSEIVEILKVKLRKDGVLAISVPNPDSWQCRLFGYRWFHWDIPRHIFLPHPKGFVREMEKKGFSFLYSSSRNLEQNPYGFVQSLLNSISGQHNLLYEQLKGNISLRRKPVLLFHWAVFLVAFPISIIGDWLASLINKGATMDYYFRKQD